MKSLRTASLLIASLSIAALAPAAVVQVEISWGSSLSEEKMILSDGSAFDPATATIELGTFAAGFTPTHDNMGEWVTQWRVFDAITDTDPGFATDDPDPTVPTPDFFNNVDGPAETVRFAGMGHLLTDQTSNSEDASPGYAFAAGQQGYLFIRIGDVMAPGSEWLLLTSNNDTGHLGDSVWQFPAAVGGQPQFALAWWLADADTAIVGAVDGGSLNGGDTGMGSYTDTSTDFSIRLHGVPEPSSSALVLLFAAILVFRRPRR